MNREDCALRGSEFPAEHTSNDLLFSLTSTVKRNLQNDLVVLPEKPNEKQTS